MSRSIDIEEVRRDLSLLLDEIEAGAQFIVTREGKPVALLAPAEIPMGLVKDSNPDSFFGPLPGELQAWEQGRNLVRSRPWQPTTGPSRRPAASAPPRHGHRGW